MSEKPEIKIPGAPPAETEKPKAETKPAVKKNEKPKAETKVDKTRPYLTDDGWVIPVKGDK